MFDVALSMDGGEARWAWGMECWTRGRPVTSLSVAGLWNPFSGPPSHFCSNWPLTGHRQWVFNCVCVFERERISGFIMRLHVVPLWIQVRMSRPRSYCEGMELVDLGKSWTAWHSWRRIKSVLKLVSAAKFCILGLTCSCFVDKNHKTISVNVQKCI